MFSVDAELEFLLQHPLCGGAPEGEGEREGEASQGAVSEGQAELDASAARRDADDTGRQAAEHMIPKHRFDEVNNRFNAYKVFGSPEELKAKLARLEALERQPQNRYTQDQAKEIREDLLRVFPELQGVLETQQTQTKSFVSFGVKQNEKFLQELGVEVNENNNNYLQELLGGVIARTPELTTRFLARDQTVFADAFKAAKTAFWPNTKRAVPGLDKTQIKTPAKPGSTGKPAQKAQASEIKPGPLMERELLDKAGEEAFELLSSQME
jgi:hypothetical protein